MAGLNVLQTSTFMFSALLFLRFQWSFVQTLSRVLNHPLVSSAEFDCFFTPGGPSTIPCHLQPGSLLSCLPSSLLGPAFSSAPPWAEQLSAGAAAMQREQAAAIFHGVLKPAFSSGTTCRVSPGSCSHVFYKQTKCQVLITFSWLSTLCSIKIGIFR